MYLKEPASVKSKFSEALHLICYGEGKAKTEAILRDIFGLAPHSKLS